MAMVTRIVEPNEILISAVADKQIEPTVTVDVGARNRDGRPNIDCIPERRSSDVFERAIPSVQKQTIRYGLTEARCLAKVKYWVYRSVVQSVANPAVGGHVKILIAVVIEVACRRCRTVACECINPGFDGDFRIHTAAIVAKQQVGTTRCLGFV